MSNGLKQMDLKLNIQLSPYYLRELDQGVNNELKKYLLKYIPKLGGVLLAWWDMRFLSEYGNLLWEFTEIHIKVGVRVLVWAPKVGEQMIGTVQKRGPDYLALLVYQTWSVFIRHQNLPANLSAESGDIVEFTVIKLDINNDIMSIEGTLLEHVVEEDVPEVVEEISEQVELSIELDDYNEMMEENVEKVKQKKKKSKKRTRNGENGTPKKKRRRSKKQT
eukprot:TRINITY_DN10964_c0_g1_i2.p1 TRINITY_DN10964_c0_g1~~TRINITY_DN10964_c0_g1_i2.p1  ORF type:complete len:220 (+),score=56.11 TRINITY_DN10964_c0_g1_i2:110-769(+)